MSDCTPDSYDSSVEVDLDDSTSYDATSYDSGTSMSIDLDGDGQAETTLIDMDADGVVDAVDVLDPRTGAEMVVVDSDADGTMDTAIADMDGDGTFEIGVDERGYFDPSAAETEPDVVDPFAPVDPENDAVHGDPMAEIPYHQAQVGPNDCLPTSVAMVLTEITGEEVPQGDLVDLANELDLLGPTGMSVEGGVQLLEHYGVDAEVRTGSVDDLRSMLDAGKPVIIGLDSDDLYGVGDQPFSDDLVAGHAVVITGIDDEAGLVYINDPGFPDGAGVAIPLADFEDAWVDAENTMIVADDPKTEEDGLAGIPNPDRKGRIYDLILLPFTLVLR